jgi:hypothetical protein
MKFGNEYYPSLPIQGNSSTNYGSPNNFEFYYTLMQAFGKAFDVTGMLINESNFAVDNRYYYGASDLAIVQNTIDLALQCNSGGAFPGIVAANANPRLSPWALLQMYSSPIINTSWENTLQYVAPVNTNVPHSNYILNYNYVNAVQTLNFDGSGPAATNWMILVPASNATAYNQQLAWRFMGNSQLCNYYENRLIGKALYAMDFEQADYSGGVIGGLNTTPYKPYQMILKQGAEPSQYNRLSEAYVFGCCDVSYNMRGKAIYRSGIN